MNILKLVFLTSYIRFHLKNMEKQVRLLAGILSGYVRTDPWNSRCIELVPCVLKIIVVYPVEYNQFHDAQVPLLFSRANVYRNYFIERAYFLVRYLRPTKYFCESSLSEEAGTLSPVKPVIFGKINSNGPRYACGKLKHFQIQGLVRIAPITLRFSSALELKISVIGLYEI